MGVSVILLAAGYATRLYPLTKDQPKALLPLGPVTILDEVIRSVDTIPGLSKQVLVTNSRFAGQFKDWQRSRRAPVAVIDDGTRTAETRLGAIRDLELARRQVPPGDDLLVVGTDNVFEWTLGDFVKAAQRRRPAPSLGLWQAPSSEDATQFGVVVRDATSRVTSFAEKSKQPPSREVALCVYYFPAEMTGKIQAFIDAGENTDAPGYFLKWLAERGEVYGIMMPGAWYDIGSLESYQLVQREWAALPPTGGPRQA
jgi:glucose-1-phosphate thymidylyltransferase